MLKLSITEAQKKQILIGAGSVIGLLFWTQILFLPQQRTLSATSSELRTLQKKLREAHHNLTELPRLEKEYAQLSTSKGIASAAPAEQQLLETFNAVSEMARLSQVQMTTLKPKVGLNRLVPSQSGFLELPVEADATGGYHQFGAFLDTLEHSDLFLKLQALEIRPDSKSIWKHEAIFIFQVSLFPTGKEQAKP